MMDRRAFLRRLGVTAAALAVAPAAAAQLLERAGQRITKASGLYEYRPAHRVLVEHNVFDGFWVGEQREYPTLRSAAEAYGRGEIPPNSTIVLTTSQPEYVGTPDVTVRQSVVRTVRARR